ncbi:Di-sulfide bridge nucleocytoplasmic transport domain-containing protein [Leptodontidium sp. 2 PMI_412]|nr:Di-sulfide bridge nucleocytoplasmic transport domain-containing protein [Leptodontidium sp. MPI-SDFR-AT-0119]KAH9213760.1 Di-sulfide bridge nucleocytoplasmic transport domain-containing protein [Leptodontidium sp. 2 PMI_412]
MFSNIQAKRSHESPMDWEWQTSGPTDPKSPFPQGPKGGFESPRPTSSFMGASSTPAAPFRNPSFTTPRKPFDQDLFSEVSGAESSPADNADAEDTPELPKSSQTMTAFSSGTVRQPIFGKYGTGFLGSSPGRADQRRGKYANAIVHKVRKRKRMERDYALVRGHRDGSDSESDDSETRPRSRSSKHSKSETSQPGWFASMFNYIESHPNLPNVLSYYAQLGVNGFIAALTIFGIYSFWMTVQADVDKASEKERALVQAEIVKCAQEFLVNKCGADMRLPALHIPCDNWEHCMNRDPNSIGRAQVSAHTFAQIFNSFIEPISYKAMIFVVMIVTVCILINNLAFSTFRSKANHHMPTSPPFYPPQQPPTPFQWGNPPQTPQHNNMGYDIYGGQTYQQIMPSQTPGQRSPSKGSRSPSKGSRSPSKGDRYLME